jgi:hypothetical protein
LGAYRERYREVILERGMKEKEEGRGLLNEWKNFKVKKLNKVFNYKYELK